MHACVHVFVCVRITNLGHFSTPPDAGPHPPLPPLLPPADDGVPPSPRAAGVDGAEFPRVAGGVVALLRYAHVSRSLLSVVGLFYRALLHAYLKAAMR